MPIINISGINQTQGKHFFNDIIMEKILPIIGGSKDNVNVIINQNEIFATNNRVIINIQWLKRPAEIEQTVAKIVTEHFNSIFKNVDVYLIFNEINEQLYVDGKLK